MLRSKGIKTMQTIFRGARAMHVVDLTWVKMRKFVNKKSLWIARDGWIFITHYCRFAISGC
uniref:Uncharacterized protein n=1 Tax=Triticum urartu TaxID=4572 RepID=A0A8R7UI58_TRIUA